MWIEDRAKAAVGLEKMAGDGWFDCFGNGELLFGFGTSTFWVHSVNKLP